MKIRRMHLFEIEDQGWCPPVIRDAVTDFLAFLVRAGKQYAPAIRWLNLVLDECEPDQITDLCSGGGGPWPSLLRALMTGRKRYVSVCLTDKYPNVKALSAEVKRAEGALTFHAGSVDATVIPSELGGVRTLFTAFHHFAPEQARAIVQDAVRQRHAICVFEATQRSLMAVALTCLSPLIVLFVTPFIRPFRLSRLLLTYVIPLIPLAVLFDGIVSCLRTYSPDDLREMLRESSLQAYTWHVGEEQTESSPIPMTYLVGYPKRSARPATVGPEPARTYASPTSSGAALVG